MKRPVLQEGVNLFTRESPVTIVGLQVEVVLRLVRNISRLFSKTVFPRTPVGALKHTLPV